MENNTEEISINNSFLNDLHRKISTLEVPREKQDISERGSSLTYEPKLSNNLETHQTCIDLPTTLEFNVDLSKQEAQKSSLHSLNNNEEVALIDTVKKEQSSDISLYFVKNKQENTDNPVYVKEESIKPNFLSCEQGNSDAPLKSEIDVDEAKIQFDSESCIKSETSEKTPQLQIILETLSIANENHKKAIDNLADPVIELKKLDLRIIRKVNKFGFVKTTSDLLKPLFPQPQKKSYPKGHYFSRKQDVVYKEEKFDKHFFHLALRRGATIDDGGKFLKYQCPTCPYKSWSFTALSSHHSGLHGFKINYTFTCPDCEFTAKNECSLKRHTQRHKKEPDLQCPHCPYITRFDVALRVHLRRWHLPQEEGKTLRCSHCNFRSVCRTTFDAHVRVHLKSGNHLYRFVHNSEDAQGAEILKCEYCTFESRNKNALRRHMQETHKINNPFEKELYRCKFCGFETVHLFSFKDHSKLHKGDDEVTLFHCFNCDFKTKWKKYLTLHMRTDHPRPTKVQKEVTYYHCAHCDMRFIQKYPLKVHIFKQHRDTEILMCHYCNYTTKSIQVLKRHTQVRHVNPREHIYKCQKCSHISKDRAMHKKHLRTHKYICYECGCETSCKTSLRYHIIGHMSKKKQRELTKIYQCQCCEYETRNKHHFERHMRRLNHYPEKALEEKEKKITLKNKHKEKPLKEHFKNENKKESLENNNGVEVFDVNIKAADDDLKGNSLIEISEEGITMDFH